MLPSAKRHQVNFSATFLSGPAQFQTNFRDESIGKTKSWLWDFGDGKSSREKDPIHIYENSGVYTVTLKVGFTDGTTAKHTKIAYILVTEAQSSYICELTLYEWYQYDEFNSYSWWTHNNDGTLFADSLHYDSEVSSVIPRISYGFFDFAGKKCTIKIIYHNDINSLSGVVLYDQFSVMGQLVFNHNLDSTRIHINTTGLASMDIVSVQTEDAPAGPGTIPNSSNWIECIQIIENDWTGEAENVVIYD